jgi:hypothetical protein
MFSDVTSTFSSGLVAVGLAIHASTTCGRRSLRRRLEPLASSLPVVVIFRALLLIPQLSSSAQPGLILAAVIGLDRSRLAPARPPPGAALQSGTGGEGDL